MASLKPLIVRSNRLLGASLVEKGLVSIDELNEPVIELILLHRFFKMRSIIL